MTSIPTVDQGIASGSLRIAVLIPCYNEAVAIQRVVEEFQRVLPAVPIYVYDNNSADDTIPIASRAGAIVRTERTQGKGNVVCRMFADIEADVYVLVDGDDTYSADSAPEMIRLLVAGQLDMVNGRRVTSIKAAYRQGHVLGNQMLTLLIAFIFGNRFDDILSGYRVFSRRFVKTFPARSSGFEIETQLTVHALELKMPVAEANTPYKERPVGSSSKLHTYRDGWSILKIIVLLCKHERPLFFFGIVALAFLMLAIVLAIPLFTTYIQTGLVPRFPTAILVMGLIEISFLSFVCGLILDTVTVGRREAERLHYLSMPAISADTLLSPQQEVLPWIRKTTRTASREAY